MLNQMDLVEIAVEQGGLLDEWTAEFERDFNQVEQLVNQTKQALERGTADGDSRLLAQRLQRMVNDGNP